MRTTAILSLFLFTAVAASSQHKGNSVIEVSFFSLSFTAPPLPTLEVNVANTAHFRRAMEHRSSRALERRSGCTASGPTAVSGVTSFSSSPNPGDSITVTTTCNSDDEAVFEYLQTCNGGGCACGATINDVLTGNVVLMPSRLVSGTPLPTHTRPDAASIPVRQSPVGPGSRSLSWPR